MYEKVACAGEIIEKLDFLDPLFAPWGKTFRIFQLNVSINVKKRIIMIKYSIIRRGKDWIVAKTKSGTCCL